MKNKTIYKIVTLVMVLTMIPGNIIQTKAAMPVIQATGPLIYWGAMVEAKAPSTTNLQGVFNTFETRSRKRMSIIHWGQSWIGLDGSSGEFQTSYFDNVRNHGSIPMLNWASQKLGVNANQPDFQSRDIYEGRYDAYITRWATAARNWGHPFFLRFDHESNGWWYPWGEGKLSTGAIVNGNSSGDFIRAWRHVYDIFTSAGAINVTWVWSLNNMGNTSQYPALSTIYPGDDYVDWTGFSVYNKYNTWTGLKPLLIGGEGGTWLKDSYDEVVTVAPNKPVMLSEFASIEAGDGTAKKAAWITDALTAQVPTTFPKIKGIVWMNWDVNEGKTYPIESSQAATDAWAAGIGSPLYATNQYANLNTSPIPPLTASPTGTSTLVAIADSYIDSANPASTAGGASTTLFVNSSPVQTTFLKFDLTPLAGKTISSVTLKFKTTSDTNAGSVNNLNVKLVNNILWKERYLSYSNSVSISTTVLGIVPANSTPNTWYEITLAPSDIQQKVGSLLSVAIEATGSDKLLLYSREATDKPQIIVTSN